jgi:hypothetical protein
VREREREREREKKKKYEKEGSWVGLGLGFLNFKTWVGQVLDKKMEINYPLET